MRRFRLKQALLVALVLSLPIAAVIIQGVQISGYEEDLLEADMQAADSRAALEIGARMLNSLDNMVNAILRRSSVYLDQLADPASRISFLVAQQGSATGMSGGRNGAVYLALTDGKAIDWAWTHQTTLFNQVNLPATNAQDVASQFRTLATAEPGEPPHRFSEFLSLPSTIRDADDVPYWMYAAIPVVSESPTDYGQIVLNRATEELRFPVAPFQAAQLQAILDELRTDWPDETDAVAGLLNQREAQYADLASISPTPLVANLRPREWRAYEHNLTWLIGSVATPVDDATLVAAVDVEALLARAVPELDATEITLSTIDGFPLGDRLLGLRARLPPDRALQLARTSPELPSIYEVTVILAILLAILGAWFLWRDTKREAALTEMRSQFISGVSHELKTPLTSIRMFAETIQIADETGVDTREKRADHLEIIVRESERLTRLLNNVLAFSQIERGERRYHMRKTALQDIVRDAARIMQFPLREQGFDLKLNIADDIAPVPVDADALEQAILNLLSNAMKYSGDNRHIELGLSTTGYDAIISVTDHGIGIAEPEQQRIFESFYRVRVSGNEAIAGTGLGLAIVDHIARAHRASVNVKSRPGAGSTFTIRIPLQGAAIA